MEEFQIPLLPQVLFQDAAIQLWLTHQAVALPGRRFCAGLSRAGQEITFTPGLSHLFQVRAHLCSNMPGGSLS